MPLKLTEALIDEIARFVRGGSFPEIAAEANGIPRDVFNAWMERGQQKKARRLHRLLVVKIMTAAAEARASAETKTLLDHPKEWLKSGPGREKADLIGWTTPVKPQAPAQSTQANVFLDPEFMELCQTLLRILEPYPEIRVKVAEALSQKQTPGKGGDISNPGSP